MAEPRPVVVPILRAGLGMLEGMTRLLPTAQVGFLGMVRDEKRCKRVLMPIVCQKISLDAIVLF
jgi:uracil phosphoribosyltransferase